MLHFCAERAGVDDGAFNGAEEAVRECVECGRGGGLGLHGGAPKAESEPKHGEREPGDALGAEGGEDAERGEWRECQEDERRANPEPVGKDNAQCEEPGGMEERDGSQSGGRKRVVG